MSKIVNNFLLAGDKFMSKMHLRYSARIVLVNIEELEDSRYTYQNELDKSCFQHDMGYGDFKNLLRRTTSNKILRDQVFNIAKNSKCDECQCRFASIVYKCFNKNSLGGAVTRADKSAIKSEIMPNQQLAEELHNPIIRKLKKRKVYSSFKDKI